MLLCIVKSSWQISVLIFSIQAYEVSLYDTKNLIHHRAGHLVQ